MPIQYINLQKEKHEILTLWLKLSKQFYQLNTEATFNFIQNWRSLYTWTWATPVPKPKGTWGTVATKCSKHKQGWSTIAALSGLASIIGLPELRGFKMNKYTFNLTTLIFPPPNHISNFFCKSVQRAQSLKTLFRSHHSHRNVLDCALPHQVGKMETEGAPCTAPLLIPDAKQISLRVCLKMSFKMCYSSALCSPKNSIKTLNKQNYFHK